MNLGSGWVGSSREIGGRKMHVKKLLGEGGFAFVYLVVDGFSVSTYASTGTGASHPA